jgi:hypothetical protein
MVLWHLCDCILARYYALLVRKELGGLGNIAVIGYFHVTHRYQIITHRRATLKRVTVGNALPHAAANFIISLVMGG